MRINPERSSQPGQCSQPEGGALDCYGEGNTQRCGIHLGVRKAKMISRATQEVLGQRQGEDRRGSALTTSSVGGGRGGNEFAFPQGGDGMDEIVGGGVRRRVDGWVSNWIWQRGRKGRREKRAKFGRSTDRNWLCDRREDDMAIGR